MAKRKTRKTGKQTAGKSRSKAGKPRRKPATSAKASAQARKASPAKPPGSGLVYTSLLREALAGRTR